MRAEQRAHIRRLVDAAPPLTAEDAARLRALVPLGSRRAAEQPAVRTTRRPAARPNAA